MARGSYQVLEQLDKSAIYEFWKVCRLYENEGWWCEINSSSLPAIPVSRENPSLHRQRCVLTLAFSDILIRWRIYIEECGLRGLCGQSRDFSLPEFKSKGRIDVGSFLNLADLIWGEFSSPFRPSPTMCIINAFHKSQISSGRTNRTHSFEFPGSMIGSLLKFSPPTLRISVWRRGISGRELRRIIRFRSFRIPFWLNWRRCSRQSCGGRGRRH